MSETSTTTPPADGDAAPMVRRGLAVVLVILLIGGSAMLSNQPSKPYEGASDYIAAFYADADAQAMIAAWDEQFVDQFGGPTPQLEADVTGLLSQPVEVVDESLEVVAGVALVRVTTSDQINWCVRPDGTILPTCVLGTMTATVDASGLGAEARVLGGGLDLDTAEVTFDMLSSSPDPIMLNGSAEIQGDEVGWELADVTQLAGGDFFPPAEDGSLTIGGPFSLRVTMRIDLGGGGQVPPSTFDLVFPEGTVTVSIPGPDYWFG